MGTHEPCQVRKEAALSGLSHVPRGNLDRANCLSNAYGWLSKEGARQLYTIKNTHPFRVSFFVCFVKINFYQL